MCEQCAKRVVKLLDEMQASGEFDGLDDEQREVERQTIGVRIQADMVCPSSGRSQAETEKTKVIGFRSALRIRGEAWVPCAFDDLQAGDLFALVEPDGTEVPVIALATTGAESTSGPSLGVVQAIDLAKMGRDECLRLVRAIRRTSGIAGLIGVTTPLPFKLSVEHGQVTLSDVFNGVGIVTDQGRFGIAQRDDGIEVLLNGELVWSSAEVSEVSGEICACCGEAMMTILQRGHAMGSAMKASGAEAILIAPRASVDGPPVTKKIRTIAIDDPKEDPDAV